MSFRVRLSFGERFLNWFRRETKLYIRGERGKDHAEVFALDKELAGQLNAWIATQREGRAEAERDELRAEVERLTARGIEDLRHENDELRAEVERLTKERDEAAAKLRSWWGDLMYEEETLMELIDMTLRHADAVVAREMRAEVRDGGQPPTEET